MAESSEETVRNADFFFAFLKSGIAHVFSFLPDPQHPEEDADNGGSVRPVH